MNQYKKIVETILVIVCTAMMSGCVNVQTQKLAAYDQAIKLSGPARPKLFLDGIKIDTALTPYLIIVANSTDASRDTIIRNIWWKAAEHKADVVIIRDGGSQYNGSIATSSYLGNGLSAAVAFPVYNKIISGICFRLNPSRVGFQYDQNQMIINISNESLSAAGIIEGDKIISINDISFSANMPELMSFSPLQEVKITIIRPGTGRLTKTIKTMTNEPIYLNYTDALSWEDAPKPADKSKCLTPINCPQ